MNKYSYICLAVIDYLKKYISEKLRFPLPLFLVIHYLLLENYISKCILHENACFWKLRNFIEKKLCCSLSFDKILVCRSAYFPNTGLQHRCCSLNFQKFSTALLHVGWIDLFKAVGSRTRFPMKVPNFSHNLLVAKFFTQFASG